MALKRRFWPGRAESGARLPNMGMMETVGAKGDNGPLDEKRIWIRRIA
jgi:hypothetical protein